MRLTHLARAHREWCLIALAAVALPVTDRAACAQEPAAAPLFAIVDRAAREGQVPGSAREHIRRVRLDDAGLRALASPRGRLRVALPDGRIATIRGERRESLPDGGLYWAGTVDAPAAGRMRLVRRRGAVAAAIEIDGDTWTLTPGPAGTHVIERAPDGDVRCGGGRVAAFHLAAADLAVPAPRTGTSEASASSPSGVLVDLLMIFTGDAVAALGGEDGMRATADLAVAATNDALANSLVDARVRLVDVRAVAYAESRSMNLDLDRVTGVADGFMDEVHALRDASGADLVSLVVESNIEGIEGLAWLMQQPSVAFQSLAFSVVLRRSFANLTLAHEIGHNLGLTHDRANASSPGVYTFGYGYRDPPYFRDLMSYACTGVPCPRIAYYSNPDVLYAGRPTGRADLEDGARALRLTMPVAAQFRTGSGPVLTSVSPSQVPTLGDVRVTLAGTRLATATRVLVGGLDASGFVVTSPGTLSIVVPRRPQGPADVVVEDEQGQTSLLPGALVYVPSAADADGDALDDDWELAMGLDPGSAVGADGPDGDPDGDGVTNLRERLEHGHPRGRYRRYLAEGASGSFLSTQLAILNPGGSAAGAVVRFLVGDGTPRSTWLGVPPLSRRTVSAAAVAKTAGGTEFSLVVESQAPLVVDRTMWWDATRYGAHAETSVAAPASRWYLAEGATTRGFNLFYLLQNPGDSEARVAVRYLRAVGSPIERTYLLPPRSRTNVWVNREPLPDGTGTLDGAELSAVIDVQSGPPIVVERAMYRDLPGQVFGAGHESAGVTAPATTWFLAEGATGPYFDLFVLLANPADDRADVVASFLLPDGSTIERAYAVPPASRFTIWVDHEDPRLADTAVSTTVRSTNDVPIVVERAMWWPGDSASWAEAHHAAGATVTAARWALAEGEVGGASNVETYVLVANTSTTAVDVRVTVVPEDGPPSMRTFRLVPRSRFNVDVRTEFPIAVGRRFATIVESMDGNTGLVVERAMYWDAAGQRWAAGTDALGTPLP